MTTDQVSKILYQHFMNIPYEHHNSNTSTVVKTNKILDHWWNHTSNSNQDLSHVTLNQPECYTSDHYSSLIIECLDTPLLNLEKVNWQKLKLPKFQKNGHRTL